jgi:ABC transporter substrate binding protein
MRARGVRSVVSIRYRQLGLAATLLIIWVVLTGASAPAPRSIPYRVGVLTSRLTFNLTLEGLREGLAQLGYRQGKPHPLRRRHARGSRQHGQAGRKSCGGQARCHVHRYHRADDCSQAGNHNDSHRFLRCCQPAAVGMQAAKLEAKILKGTKPSEMPVQMPVELPLAINLTSAKAIGLDIPRNILERTVRFME